MINPKNFVNLDYENFYESEFLTTFNSFISKNTFLKKERVSLLILKIFSEVIELENVKIFLKLDNLLEKNIDLNHILYVLIGFIDVHINYEYKMKLVYSKIFNNFFEFIAEKYNLNFKKLLLTEFSIKDEIAFSNLILKKQKLNKKKLKFYEGWNIVCENNESIYLNLYPILETYGEIYCQRVYKGFIQLSKVHPTSTFKRKIESFKLLHKYLIAIYKNLTKLKNAISPASVSRSLINVHNYMLIDYIENERSLNVFKHNWNSIIFLYKELIEYGVYEKSIFPIISPILRSSEYTDFPHTKTYGDLTFNTKSMTNIPLHYTDKEAKEKIFQEVLNDIKHVVKCCEEAIKITYGNYINFIELANSGEIKPIFPPTYSTIKVGKDHLPNTYKTYLNQPFINKNRSNYRRFLNIDDDNLIFFSSYKNIYPYLILLINEHPEITEGALLEWKYYTNKEITGFRKANDGDYITLYKRRRKSDNAEQHIKLNEVSKNLVNQIISLTSIAREYLRKEGDSNYEYMLLTSPSPFTLPTPIKSIFNPSSYRGFNYYEDIFVKDTFDKYGQKIRNKEEAFELINNISLTRFRASKGIQVYLETSSVHSMSIALGHKKYEPKLIKHYLPDSLWSFFTDRWVRIFQNAFVYEAMKDSKNLFKAIDISETELKQFLSNHQINDIPDILKSKKDLPPEELELIGVFPISTVILQWFIAITTLINSEDNYNKINRTAKRWYECASLVISQIELSVNRIQGYSSLIINEEIKEMYELAKANPISTSLVEKALKL